MFYRQLYICDVEKVYLKRLSSYLSRHPGFMWKIKTYTELSQCLGERPEILLVSGRALKQMDSEKGTVAVPDIKGCQIILLEDDSGNPGIELSISKYQSAGKLYEDLMEILGENLIQNTEVIGIYGPSSGPEAEIFAENIGREQLNKGEVLIIPLTEFSTFSRDEEDDSSISEWFYYRAQKSDAKKRLRDWTYKSEGLDYLKGFRTVYDRMEIQLEEWSDFFKEGLRKSHYTTIILVFDRLPKYMELFVWCDRIFVQWGEDGYGDLRKKVFLKMVSYMGMTQLLEKINVEQERRENVK